MRMEEYLSVVTEQIRCKKARGPVEEELKAHILEQAEAYEADGMFPDDALSRAVREMGDPVETGVSLDRIHRPGMSVELLILSGFLCLFSLALQAALSGSMAESFGSAGGFLKNVSRYTVCGYLLMLIVYRLDYSVLARWGKELAGAFLLFILLGTQFFGVEIRGAVSYIMIGPLHVFLPMVMYLFVPLYGAVLYRYRGEGLRAFGKLFLWAAVPTALAFRIPSINLAVCLYVSFAVLFTVAVWRGWYAVAKKRVLAVFWSVFLAAPAALLIVCCLAGYLGSWQAARLQAFLAGSIDSLQLQTAAACLSGSSLLGGSAENLAQLQNLEGFHSDFALVSLICVYGILAGVLAAALLSLLILKIFQVSSGQRNQLGMIVGMGCGIVFLMQTVMNLLVVFGLFPTTSVTLPFLSYGGSAALVDDILLGLVMSVFRYQNILPGSKPLQSESAA